MSARQPNALLTLREHHVARNDRNERNEDGLEVSIGKVYLRHLSSKPLHQCGDGGLRLFRLRQVTAVGNDHQPAA
jgi:hypothetical protein